MAINTTSTLSNSLIARYKEAYEDNVSRTVAYDQLAVPWTNEMNYLNRLSSANFTFLSEMDAATSTISETEDVTPEQLVDATAQVSPTSRWGAIQDSERIMHANHVGYGLQRMKVVANNAAEGIDNLAIAVALAGGVVIRAAARASLDAGTAGNRFTEAAIAKAEARYAALKPPWYVEPNGTSWGFAIMGDEPYYDLLSGGNVQAISQYQNGRIILNRELGSIGKFKLIVPDWPKVFGGAGADNATAIATTLNGAVEKLATTVTVASGTNIAVGMQMTIGTEETANTFYPANERVTVTSISGTTMGVAGSGSNGGLRYDHASGVAVRNADSVYPVVFGSNQSLVKMYSPEVGEFGDIVIKKQGLLDQFMSVGWKFYGNYGLIAENRLLRGEYSSSMDA